MGDFSTLLQQGAGNAWLFIPSAILLGALHGLEPGHSKTMMAAFIIAIRGTIGQAIMLGLAATLSHTAVVWLVAFIGMYFGSQWNAESTEPYFQLASSVLIIGIALWMAWHTWRQSALQKQHDHVTHTHGHEETKWIDTGHGTVRLEIFETGVPPRFRFFEEGHHKQSWQASDVRLQTTRSGDRVQEFSFVQRDGFLESLNEIPEPHEFTARLSLAHGGHDHHYDLVYQEHTHGHRHATATTTGLDIGDTGYQDPHELAHANDIQQRFKHREVTNGQIVLFGLTEGLIPCPAAITVLLLCLQLKKVVLGGTLVLCFSIGLALTMVFSGVIAAISVRHAAKRWSGFGEFARKAPYFSSVLIVLVGLYVGYHGWIGLPQA